MHPSAPQLLWVPSQQIAPPSTWNSADKDSGITLSGGNLIATRGAGGTPSAVRGTLSRSSGLRYFELTVTTSVTTGRFGIANSTAGLTTALGEDVNGWGLRGTGPGSGDVRNNAATAVSGVAPVAGDVIGFHVDLNSLLLYLRINGTNYATMDPVGVAGGLTIASGSWFPAFSSSTNGDAATLNVGASAFNTSPASGYSAWG